MAPKRKAETLDEALNRLWCYYCERDFPGFKDLCDHQRHKHFKCTYDPRSCNRKLQTAGGLKVHMTQVHKSDLKEVPNAIPGRTALEPEVFAMDGVPEHLIQKHREAILKKFSMEEAEYMKRTGNSLHGTNEPSKKAKIDVVASTDDTKAAARAFKQKKMEQRRLRDEAIARGEEPPKFEAIMPSKVTPAAPNPTPVPVPAIAAEPSISPPAPAAAAWQMPPTMQPTMQPNMQPNMFSQPAYGGHPLPMAPHNAYSPQPMHSPYNPYGYPMGHPPASPGMQQPYPMARPPPPHSADLFREQHPLHGLPSQPPSLPSHLPRRPSGLPVPPSSVPSLMSPTVPSRMSPTVPASKLIPKHLLDNTLTFVIAPEAIESMIDEVKRNFDAEKQANEMSQKTVAQPDTKLNTNSSSELPIRAASTNGGMLMRNSSLSWEEKRGQHPRYSDLAPKCYARA